VAVEFQLCMHISCDEVSGLMLYARCLSSAKESRVGAYRGNDGAYRGNDGFSQSVNIIGTLYTVFHKNVAVYFRLQLFQILANSPHTRSKLLCLTLKASTFCLAKASGERMACS